MKLKAIIIDDEPLAHDVITEYIKDIPFIEVVKHCHLATEALTFLGQEPVDLIFLDIQMPKLKGLDFLKILQKKPLVIITSAYQEYALESFELEVCDYLLKPFRFERFLKAVNRAFELFQLMKPAESHNVIIPQEKNTEDRKILIKVDKKLVHIELDDIYCLESLGNYVKVWLEDKFLLTARTLTSFEEQLPPEEFIRIHKSYIINKNYINYQEGNIIVLKNERKLQIGKNYKKVLKL